MEPSRAVILWNFALAFAVMGAGSLFNRLAKRPVLPTYYLTLGVLLESFIVRNYWTLDYTSDPNFSFYIGYETGSLFWPMVVVFFIGMVHKRADAKVAAEQALRLSQAREADLKLRTAKVAGLVEMGRTVSSINHELGNVLDGIRYQVEDLTAARIDHPAVHKALPKIEERVNRLDTQLNGLRDLGRPIDLKVIPIKLPLFLESILMDVKELPLAAATKFNVHVPPEIETVHADELWMRQALYNLMKNALEATAGRPEPAVSITASIADKNIRIDVTDNGNGMDEAALNHLFEPFYSTKGDAGTGMGLAISRRIAELHGGSIEVKSDVGKGTTFAVLIPKEPMMPPAEP